MGRKELFDLHFQTVPDGFAAGLEVQPFGNSVLRQAEQTGLYVGKGILQTEIQHRLGRDSAVPDLSAFGKLQAHPQAEPAFPCFAGPRQQAHSGGEQVGNQPPYRRQRGGK